MSRRNPDQYTGQDAYNNNQQQWGGGGYGQQQQGGWNQQQQGGYGGYSDQQDSYEMNARPGQGGSDEDAFHNEIQSLRSILRDVENNDFKELEQLNIRLQNSPDQEQQMSITQRSREVETRISASINDVSNGLQRLRNSATQGNKHQIESVFNKYKETVINFQRIQGRNQNRVNEQLARSYRTAVQGASEEEVQQAIQSGRAQQIFAQNMMHGRQVLSANQDRNEEVRRLAETMQQLAELFKNLNETVIQQQEVTTQIEQHAETAHLDIDNGVKQTDQAVTSAKAARKKKWWCLLIVIIILIIVAIAVYFAVRPKNNNNPKKRSLDGLVFSAKFSKRQLEGLHLASRSLKVPPEQL